MSGHPRVHRDPVDAYRLLAEIGEQIHRGGSDIEEVFAEITRAARRLLRADVAWLVLADVETRTIAPVVLDGFRSSAMLEQRLPIEHGVGGRALRTGSAVTATMAEYDAIGTPDTARVAGVLRAEGIGSLLCAPMIREDDLVGSLYVAYRGDRAPDEHDTALLVALAAQASVAIRNRRLHDDLVDRNRLLSASARIHEQLTRASLGGVGLSGIAELLGRLVGAPVEVEPSLSGVAPVGDRPAAHVEGEPVVAVPIEAGGHRLGVVRVRGCSELAPVPAAALAHGATVIALELVRMQAALEVEHRLGDELAEELLNARPDDLARLTRRAARMGIEVTGPHCVTVVAPAGETPTADLVSLARRVVSELVGRRAALMLTVRAGRVVLLVSGAQLAVSRSVAAEVERRATTAGMPVGIGIGPVRDLPGASYAAAEGCCRLALDPAAADSGSVVAYDDLGLLAFVLDAPGLEHTLALVRRSLGAVLRHDREARVVLLPTLEAFVAEHGHYDRTAGRLFIGTTTLKYRLARLADLLGVDPRRPEVRFELGLAFRVVRLLGARGVDYAGLLGSDPASG